MLILILVIDGMNLKDELMDIVNKKEACRELTGLLMLWDSTDVGVHRSR